MARHSSWAQRLNWGSVWWFWITILGVFYCGLAHVLPEIYMGFSDVYFLAHHICCYFMLIQMLINWTCIKLVGSSYHHDKCGVDSATMNNMNNGFEIDLTHLKNGEDPDTFSIPASSLSGYTKSGVNRTSPKKTMFLVTLSTPESEKNCDPNKRLVYPYWSWKPCLVCQRPRPPRTHHCPLCQSCILKRDHHCFFTGSCIGLRNQRHFTVFTFWAGVATTYSLIHSIAYIFLVFVPNNTFWDLFLPITGLRWLLGYISTLYTFMIFLLYSLVWFAVTAIGFFVEQMKIIRKGVTSFEEDNNIKVTTTGTVEENIQAVFGDFWILNFIVPMHFFYPTKEDGIRWEFVKA